MISVKNLVLKFLFTVSIFCCAKKLKKRDRPRKLAPIVVESPHPPEAERTWNEKREV